MLLEIAEEDALLHLGVGTPVENLDLAKHLQEKLILNWPENALGYHLTRALFETAFTGIELFEIEALIDFRDLRFFVFFLHAEIIEHGLRNVLFFDDFAMWALSMRNPLAILVGALELTKEAYNFVTIITFLGM